MNRPYDFEIALNEWLDDGIVSDMGDVAASGEVAQQAAESIVVHGLLADIARRDENEIEARLTAVKTVIECGTKYGETELAQNPNTTRARRIALAAATIALATCFLIMLSWHGTKPVDAATVSLERIIEASQQELDRTYVIRVVEEYAQDKRPRNLPPERSQHEPKENIDQAILHVRGSDKYVLIRSLADGRNRISGFDGKESWAFREDGPVHVSSDPNRFRGGLPGHQQDFSLVNIYSHLNELRSGYELELVTDGEERARLSGTRKSNDVRGPKRVAIWFDDSTGTVQRMLLDGLPRGKGGPKSVMFQLVDQQTLGSGFFQHASHHEADRSIRYEKD